MFNGLRFNSMVLSHVWLGLPGGRFPNATATATSTATATATAPSNGPYKKVTSLMHPLLLPLCQTITYSTCSLFNNNKLTISSML